MLYIILAPLNNVPGQVIPYSHSKFIMIEILGNLDTKEYIAQNLVVPQTMMGDEESLIVNFFLENLIFRNLVRRKNKIMREYGFYKTYFFALHVASVLLLLLSSDFKMVKVPFCPVQTLVPAFSETSRHFSAIADLFFFLLQYRNSIVECKTKSS
jgi:hypothetical protein